MIAPAPSSSRRSLRHTLAGVAAVALLTSIVACDKKPDGAAPAGSVTTTTAAAPAAAKKPKATLKLTDYHAAYKAQMDDLSKMRDPMDKKIAALVAKVGAPASDNGKKKTWYTLDGDKCTKVDLDNKDGSSFEQGTDKSDCGL